MIKIHSLKIFNLADALWGMRLPLMSHNKSDTIKCEDDSIIGENDLKLCKQLISAGPSHRKFLRQLPVSIILTAPLYWFLEFDTYKVSTTSNSSSRMHKLMSRHLTIEDFSCEDVQKTNLGKQWLNDTINCINKYIAHYKICPLEEKEFVFRVIIQMLPESFKYTRVWTGTMETLYSIVNERPNHKLSEWREFCAYVKENPLYKTLFEKENSVE